MSTDFSRDELLVKAIADIGAALALQPSNSPDVSGWQHDILQVGTSHPDPFIRAQLASTCSLRQLRLLASDRHVAVRAMCTENPMIIDQDVQLRLAHDSDASVLHALLDHCDPYRDVVHVLINCKHWGVRYRLTLRNLTADFLEQLAADPHPVVASSAKLRLTERSLSRGGEK